MSKVVGTMLLEGIFGSGRGNEEAFFSVLSPCQRNCSVVRGRGNDSHKSLETESEVNT